MCEEHKELLEMIILLAILREIIWSQLSQKRSPPGGHCLGKESPFQVEAKEAASSARPGPHPLPPPPMDVPLLFAGRRTANVGWAAAKRPLGKLCEHNRRPNDGQSPCCLALLEGRPFRRQRGASAWPGAPPPRGGVFTLGQLGRVGWPPLLRAWELARPPGLVVFLFSWPSPMG